MNEQPLDLRRILRALRRRWLLLLVLLWAGCALGYVVGTSRPMVYKARASVLLPQAPLGPGGIATRNINTQVNIARNGNILQQAGTVVDPPLDALKMRKRIKVKALTSDILEIEASASTGGDAARLADAVATEYVAEAIDATSKLTDTSISSLEAQIAKVEQRLQETKAEIDATTARVNSLPAGSPERVRQAARVDGLQLDEVEAARQLSSLTDRVAEARLEDLLKRQGTRLLAPAIRPTEPDQPAPLLFTIAGALLGLLLGVVVALTLDRRDRNLRSRSSIAGVISAPVLASLETPRRISTRACRAMLEEWEPRPLQSWALRQACTQLGVLRDGRPATVVIVGLPEDMAGPFVAAQLAIFAASTHTQTALVVTTQHPTAARLRAACHKGKSATDVRPYLSARSDPIDGGHGDGRREAALTVMLVIADADLSTIPHGATTTLAVTAGFASADTLAATALACQDAGHPVEGVFLANPDPADVTNGGLPPTPSARPARGAVQGQLGDARPASLEPGPSQTAEAAGVAPEGPHVNGNGRGGPARPAEAADASPDEPRANGSSESSNGDGAPHRLPDEEQR